ncbi:MAG TPA: hypothetical protein PKA37_18125 [Planctomycetota bacterium]|nr:hypothetical protein [Planctomycetota bacterium]
MPVGGTALLRALGIPYRFTDERSTDDSPDGIRLRAAWAESDERKDASRRFRDYTRWLAGIVGLLTYGLYSWEQSQAERMVQSSPPNPWLLYSIFIWIFYGVILLRIHTAVTRGAMERVDDRLILEQIQGAEVVAATGDSDDLSLRVLWALTQQRIDLYHRLATNQSSTSFRIGQIIMIAGFLVVIGLGALATFAPNGTAAIAASVVAVASAALSGFVGATFMKSQSEATSQLREFFLQPVEFARLLAAERLVNTLEDPETKVRAIEQVIKAMAPPVERSSQ